MPTILIVDDHSDIRRLLSITLGSSYSVLEAENGSAALALIRQEHPAVVLLDIMMPGALDGLEVLDAIRRDPLLKDTLVVLVTARGQSADYQIGQQRGADAYFIKPFSPLELLTWIREKLR
ncbi:MAG: response regulator [Betaproteobacteria bacterium]